MSGNASGQGSPPGPCARRHRAAALRALAGLALPLGVFLALHAALGNSTRALAITEAIPVAWLLAVAIMHRRLDPIALLAVVGFAVALAATALSGGGPLPLELHRALFPGAAGLACLISVAAHRPLLGTIAARQGRPVPDEPGTGLGGSLTVLTIMIGFMLIADATAQVVLALTVSTTTFVGLSHAASHTIIGVGMLACGAYVRNLRARLRRPR
ncbi:MAG TPA: hypothetical protein VHX88_06565 [Solirubrobacteraceae bacterium]|nr:hypothetical protein [Solirubrobacteraceae bacterium]